MDRCAMEADFIEVRIDRFCVVLTQTLQILSHFFIFFLNFIS